MNCLHKYIKTKRKKNEIIKRNSLWLLQWHKIEIDDIISPNIERNKSK